MESANNQVTNCNTDYIMVKQNKFNVIKEWENTLMI